jgi:uncharacterized protein YbjT (DUF2867 family)
MKTATIIGATGLIGNHLLQLLIEDPSIEKINVIVRKPLSVESPKITLRVIDFSDTVSFKKALSGSDVVFCAIGTTMKKVKGDKQAYYKIDYDIPVNAALFCKELGGSAFLLVSAIGANSQSSNFYLKLKGEVENKIGSLGIESVYFFRPSILTGKRKEFRFGERLGIAVMSAISFLLPSAYKPIKAATVARAMLRAAKKPSPGSNIWHYKEMVR